jgi:hypothetical protein
VVFIPLGLARACLALAALGVRVCAAVAARSPLRGPLGLGVIPTLGPFLPPRAARQGSRRGAGHRMTAGAGGRSLSVGSGAGSIWSGYRRWRGSGWFRCYQLASPGADGGQRVRGDVVAPACRRSRYHRGNRCRAPSALRPWCLVHSRRRLASGCAMR